MRWYFPSVNGDFRLVEGDGDSCFLEVIDPTLHEQELIDRFIKKAEAKKWLAPGAKRREIPNRSAASYRLPMDTTVAVAGPQLVKIARPKKETLTAVVFKNGRVETCEGAESAALEELGKKATGKKGAKAAASVKRPTPCCPQCLPGAIEPASEVLLDFLTPQQHDDWAERRAIVVTGGISGHRYVLAHRHSPLAQRVGKVGYDTDDDVVLHFHDWSVPPEEEVLAAKLILEHREPWLRNEATCFGSCLRYKNPFGGVSDGVPDASAMRKLGGVAQEILGIHEPESYSSISPYTMVDLEFREPFVGTLEERVVFACRDPESSWAQQVEEELLERRVSDAVERIVDALVVPSGR